MIQKNFSSDFTNSTPVLTLREIILQKTYNCSKKVGNKGNSFAKFTVHLALFSITREKLAFKLSALVFQLIYACKILLT